MVTMDFILETPKTSTVYNETDVNDKLQLENKISSLQIDNGIEKAKTASQCQNIINHVLIQSDLPNLINMTNKLDQALKEAKSQHVRKVQRALQK